MYNVALVTFYLSKGNEIQYVIHCKHLSFNLKSEHFSTYKKIGMFLNNLSKYTKTK